MSYAPNNNDSHPTDPDQFILVKRNGRCGVTRTPTPTRLSAFKGKTIEVWKKAYHTKHSWRNHGGNSGEVLIKLRIDRRALRYQPKNGKCRASSATVVSIHPVSHAYLGTGHEWGWKIDETRRLRKAASSYSDDFFYRVGDKVKPAKPFCKNHTWECASGIHFFLTQQEALEYQL